eukprot:scaffold184935_cov21-Tisochrysis_lutea.AAC.2
MLANLVDCPVLRRKRALNCSAKGSHNIMLKLSHRVKLNIAEAAAVALSLSSQIGNLGCMYDFCMQGHAGGVRSSRINAFTLHAVPSLQRCLEFLLIHTSIEKRASLP